MHRTSSISQPVLAAATLLAAAVAARGDDACDPREGWTIGCDGQDRCTGADSCPTGCRAGSVCCSCAFCAGDCVGTPCC